VISGNTAQTVARMLQGVASKGGTAPEAAIADYEIAGKTGTAQKIVNGTYSTREHVVSFVGFLPASQPRIVISVIVDGADKRAPGGRRLRQDRCCALLQARRRATDPPSRYQTRFDSSVRRESARVAARPDWRPPMIGYLSSNHALIAAFAPRPVRRTRGETIALNRVFKMAPRLADFFGESEFVAIKGSLDRPISALVIDSRRVVPGNLFFALPGLRTDGANFIDEAMSRGAVAVVTERMPAIRRRR